MMEFLPHWAYYPRSYTVHQVPAGVPSLVDDINGDLTKDVWANVPWSEPFGDIQGPNDGPPLQPALTQFKALYDDSYLYIGALLHPSAHVPATEAHFQHRNDPIFQKDSDFEVFIDVTGCNHQYKELEVNAINTVWNLLLDKPYMDGGAEHSGRIAKPGDAMYYDVNHQKTAVRVLEGAINDHEHGQALWSVEMALAYKDLFQTVPEKNGRDASVVAPSPKPPKPGDFWRINFSRVEEKGDINWTWQPQLVWNTATHSYKGVIDMHAPETWGYFHFADGNGTAEPKRDPSWPLRLAAMQIYYAQRAFFAKDNNNNNNNNKGYASSLQELKDLVDPAILEPFDLYFFVAPNTYKVIIKSQHDSMVATINQERYLILQDWDPALIQRSNQE